MLEVAKCKFSDEIPAKRMFVSVLIVLKGHFKRKEVTELIQSVLYDKLGMAGKFQIETCSARNGETAFSVKIEQSEEMNDSPVMEEFEAMKEELALFALEQKEIFKSITQLNLGALIKGT